MNLIDLLNNVSSFLVVICSWWLVHVYSCAGHPHGRPIAMLWGALGLTVAITAFVRNFQLDPNITIIITKFILVALALLIARRAQLQGQSV